MCLLTQNFVVMIMCRFIYLNAHTHANQIWFFITIGIDFRLCDDDKRVCHLIITNDAFCKFIESAKAG